MAYCSGKKSNEYGTKLEGVEDLIQKMGSGTLALIR